MRARLAVPAVISAMLLVVAPPARATWSIVVTDSATGEVAVGTATCLNGDLSKIVPLVKVGHGAAAAQAAIAWNAQNKLEIWNAFNAGGTAEDAMAAVVAFDPALQSHQYGIVDLVGPPVTFTGSQTFAHASGVAGTAGTLRYAIQGNVLTGAAVVAAAEAALLNAPGDLADKLMASMDAARAMGGDGRCSCSVTMPTSCGAPPPGFDETKKSAHIACMFLARVGDPDGVCVGGPGCATGAYYMRLNVISGTTAPPDPVLVLAQQFATWRQSWVGRPDHLRSVKEVFPKVLATGGGGALELHLVDWQGTALNHGGAAVQVTVEPGGAGVISPGPVVDHGDGTYTVPLAAAAAGGKDRLRVVVDDGQGPVTLYPFPEVSTAHAAGLTAAAAQLSVTGGDDAAFQLDLGPGVAGRPYLILVSASGTAPGFLVDAATVPLVLDQVTLLSVAHCGTFPLTDTCGVLDAQGRAQATFFFAPGELRGLHFAPLAFAAATLSPVDFATDAVVLGLVP